MLTLLYAIFAFLTGIFPIWFNALVTVLLLFLDALFIWRLIK